MEHFLNSRKLFITPRMQLEVTNHYTVYLVVLNYTIVFLGESLLKVQKTWVKIILVASLLGAHQMKL